MPERKKIPFSLYMYYRYSDSLFPIYFAAICISLGALIIGIGVACTVPSALPYVVFVISVVSILVGWWYYHKRASFLKKNEEDFKKAQEILRLRDEFFTSPPDLLRVSHPKAQAEDGWRPIRVEYHLDQAMKAELEGTVRGTFAGLFVGSFHGTIEGDISGRSTPKLFDESTFILLQKGDKVLRLISPSLETAREIMFQALDRLLNTYGKGSYSWQAVRSIGWGQKDWRDSRGEMVYSDEGEKIGKLLEVEEINPSYVHDRLAASLEKPFEQRPTVKIQGILPKEGIMLGCTAAISDEKPKILFPIEFMQQLAKRLAPLAEKELMPKEPIQLLP